MYQVLGFLQAGKINSLLDSHHLSDSADTDIDHYGVVRWAASFGAFIRSVGMPPCNNHGAMEAIDATKRMVQLYPDTFQLVTTTHEFKKAFRTSSVWLVNGHGRRPIIGNSLAALRNFYSLGIRYMTGSQGHPATTWITTDLERSSHTTATRLGPNLAVTQTRLSFQKARA